MKLLGIYLLFATFNFIYAWLDLRFVLKHIIVENNILNIIKILIINERNWEQLK